MHSIREKDFQCITDAIVQLVSYKFITMFIVQAGNFLLVPRPFFFGFGRHGRLRPKSAIPHPITVQKMKYDYENIFS